jgi:hypothetical protein
MKPVVFVLAVALVGAIGDEVLAQRGGGMAGGCQRGGGMPTMVPSTGVPFYSTALPMVSMLGNSMNMPSMASPQQQAYLQQQMQQRLLAQQAQLAAAGQNAISPKEEARQRKIAILKQRREEEQEKRAAAKAKNLERLAARK